MAKSIGIKCPVCCSEAVYRYGRAKNGNQRIKCIACGRQFIPGHERHELNNRPTCPKCGSAMHLYMHTKEMVRFRCSDYPACRSYQKVPIEEGISNELLCSQRAG
jgi:transposase-like protein